MISLIKKRWYILVVLAAIFVLVIFQVNSAGTKDKKLRTHSVKRENVRETLSLSGAIDAEEKVSLRFQSSGRMSWVGVKEGDYVKKYQTIASLDQRELKKTLQKYLNSFSKERFDYDQNVNDNWQKQYDLSKSLRETAERTLKSAQYDLNNAVLDVELQNISLEYSYLFSPIEGIVTKVTSPFAGVNITPTLSEFEIINPKTIFFSATADQADVVKLSEGIDGQIILDAYPDSKLTGKITKIAFTPKTGETGTVYEVRVPLGLDNTDYRYRFGMTGDINFVTEEYGNVIAVPSDFIKTEKDKKYVYKKVDGNKLKTYIKIGKEIDDSTIVISGLKEKDIIID